MRLFLVLLMMICQTAFAHKGPSKIIYTDSSYTIPKGYFANVKFYFSGYGDGSWLVNSNKVSGFCNSHSTGQVTTSANNLIVVPQDCEMEFLYFASVPTTMKYGTCSGSPTIASTSIAESHTVAGSVTYSFRFQLLAGTWCNTSAMANSSRRLYSVRNEVNIVAIAGDVINGTGPWRAVIELFER